MDPEKKGESGTSLPGNSRDGSVSITGRKKRALKANGEDWSATALGTPARLLRMVGLSSRYRRRDSDK